MTKRLNLCRVGLVAAMIAAAVTASAFGASEPAPNAPAATNSGSAAPARSGARAGGGLAGTGNDLGAGTPATTLSRPTTPSATPDRAGFIQRWLVLEPIPARGLTDGAVRAVVAKQYFPDQFTVVPRDSDKVSANGQEVIWHAEETNRYNLNLFHFARALRKPSGNVLFWVVTVVNAPEEIKHARLAVGSNAASVWWVNGKEVAALYNDRQTVIDDGVSGRLTLKKGANVVRGAVINGFGATDFCARFLDAQDKPLTAITITLDAPAADATSPKEQP